MARSTVARWTLRGAAFLLLALPLAGLLWWLANSAPVETARAPASPPPPGASEPRQAVEPPAVSAPPPAAVEDYDLDRVAEAWSVVDLEEVRRALPHNSYWELAAPTDDQRVLDDRREDVAHWNEQYGKVLSGTASEEEIREYFEHRSRVSSDYVEFTSYLLDHYGAQLPEQGQTLLHLARKLHLARLQELPRKQQEAFERKRAQDAAREAWLADQEAFEAALAEAAARDAGSAAAPDSADK
jgi:hypothetical protein